MTLRAGTWDYLGRLKFSLCNPAGCGGCTQPIAMVPVSAVACGGPYGTITEQLAYGTNCIAINGSTVAV